MTKDENLSVSSWNSRNRQVFSFVSRAGLRVTSRRSSLLGLDSSYAKTTNRTLSSLFASVLIWLKEDRFQML
jgi:hypothetical protein